MNPAQLLEHFDRISDAPDAVARLRRFILDLAVRGKLVEQDPNDEPAAELLKRISRITKRVSQFESKQNVEMPFEVPSEWEWSLLGFITTKTGSGSTPRGGQSVYQANGIPFLRSQNVHDDGLRLADVAYIDDITHARMGSTAVEPGDLLLNITGGSIGRCCCIPDTPVQANISQHVAIIRLAIEGMRSFVHKVVLSPFFQSIVIDEQTGAGRGGLPKNRMDRIFIPLPPLAEQHRVVAKVDELMALCDQLEVAQSKREKQRDRLVAASLHHVGTALPESLPATARFHLDNLPRLTTRPEHIKQLRQTILNLAVRGRLVPQDPNDEPAAELLKRIKAGKIKKAASLCPITSDELLISLPPGWSLARFGEVYSLEYGNNLPAEKRSNTGEYPVYGSNGVVGSHFECFVNSPCIVVGRKGSAGALNLSLTAGCCVTDVAYYCIPPSGLEVAFSFKLFHTLGLDSLGKGVKPGLSRNEAYLLPIAIPPLAEQHRVVAKVDELMALCDQLEAQLATTQADSRRLLEAVLRDALVSH